VESVAGAFEIEGQQLDIRDRTAHVQRQQGTGSANERPVSPASQTAEEQGFGFLVSLTAAQNSWLLGTL
jgi:hypothetical protein